MINKILNIGIIGCGRILQKHLIAIEKNKYLKLVAVCDTNPNVLDKLVLDNVSKYNSSKEMLKNENIDLISILTPSGLHLNNFIEINKDIKNFLIEKPIVTSIKDAQDIIKIANNNNNKVFVVLQNRFNKPILKLKEMLVNNKLGRVFLVSVKVRWSRDEKYYNQAKWRGTNNLDGGILFNQAAHHVDMMRWLNGNVIKATSYKNNLVVKGIEHEDTIVSNLKFENGAIGSLEVTVGTRPSDLEGSITVLGDLGSVEIGGFSMDRIKHWSFVDKIETPFFKQHDHIYGNGHVQLYDEVRKSIFNIKNTAPTIDDGYENIKLIDMIYKS